jgi:hypothetical protein
MLLRDSEPIAVPAIVDSSLLLSVEYASDQTLKLTFRSGAAYRYFAVPEAVVNQLIAAESKGAFFNRKIRNRFAYQRLP